jgi:phosphoglycerate dehydrogenase-like enzyme
MRLAVLDDYQGATFKLADWSHAAGVSVVPFRDHVFNKDELVARLSEFDAVMRIRERTHFTRDILEKLPRLKLLLATGMRNARSIDLKATDELGIVVSTTDTLHQSTVDIVWALLIGLIRRIPQETASFRAGGWQIGLGRGLAGQTLGVIGLGSMGIPVARIAKEFGMHVVAWSPNLTQERAAVHGVEAVTKEELFRRSDAVTIHIPLSDKTLGLVGAKELALMKKTTYLVNTSRAEIVDQTALLEALVSNSIGGAGIDVYEIEPLPVDHPFRSLPNVLATPHIGFVTEENYGIFFKESLKNLLAYRAGSPIRTITSEQPFLPDSQVGEQIAAGTLRHT